jgi:hypothetical protein
MGGEEEPVLEPTRKVVRSAPLVATWRRWGLATGGAATALVSLAAAYIAVTHSERTLASFAPGLAVAGSLVGAVFWAILRAEESRLVRELRIARTGTPVLRDIVARRREQTPLLGRALSTKLGAAAVMIAGGDRAGALDALSAGSPLMEGGRLEELRAIINADLERETGTPAGLERCVQQIHELGTIENREARLYATHVVVKAVLQNGDVEKALELVVPLETSREEEERIYAVWLRTWFDLDTVAETGDAAASASPEGALRMAALLARAQGADKLVAKLDARIAVIARPGQEE